MANETQILTRRIQIFIDENDKDKRSEIYNTLFQWRDIVFRGANMVMAHQYIQENLKDMVYLQENIKIKLADYAKDQEGILNSSRMNSTYKVLSLYFKGMIPSDILSNLNMSLIKTFNAERIDYWKGTKSLRNYKSTMPIPFSGTQIKLSNDENSKDFKFVLFKIPFRTYLGKDRTDKRVLLQKTLVGQIKICASSLQIKKGKLFLLIALELPVKNVELKPHIIAEASLSIEHPITLQIEKEHFQIGSKEEFLFRRMAIQASYHRLQRASAYNKGGSGRKKKMKSIDRFSDMERNYVNSRLHLYSRKLIDNCIKCQAGTLLLINQQQKEEVAKEEVFLLRNWSYYGLIEKIQYKASLVGINVIIE